jgi:hypothetical protein
MKSTEQLRVIKAAFAAIPELYDGFKNVRDTLLEMNLVQERRHRTGDRGFTLGVTDGAKLFVVKHLLEGFAEPDRFGVDDILCIRNEVLYAQAWAKKYRAELAPWAAAWATKFEQVDYAALIRRKVA